VRLQQAYSADAGFDSSGVEVANIDSWVAPDVLERARQLPGADSASLVRFLPLASEGFGWASRFLVPSARRAIRQQYVGGSGNVVAPGYFRVMAHPVDRGS
jgi:hypothetical protein